MALVLPVTSIVCAQAASSCSTSWAGPSVLSRVYLDIAGTACDFAPSLSDAEEGLPTILRNVSTPGQCEHFERGALLDEYGMMEVQTDEGQRMPLESFVARMGWDTPSNVSYAFDNVAGIGLVAMEGEEAAAAATAVYGDGLKRLLGPGSMQRIFTLGGDGAGHALRASGATLLSLMQGYKLWIVAPPASRLPTFLVGPRGHELRRRLDELRSAVHESGKQYVLTCVQPPGSAVFVPGGWWRATINFGDAVAMTNAGATERANPD
jgi:hypothetical protein